MKTSKILIIASLVAILATFAKSQQQQTPPQPGSGIGFPFPFPYQRPQFPFPQPNLPNPAPSTPTPPSPPQQGQGHQGQNPQVPGIADGQMRCNQALHDGHIASCILDLVNIILSHQIYLSPGCCSLITTCRPAVPAQQNPFIEQFITQYCH